MLKPKNRRADVALNAVGEFISHIADPKTGAPIAILRRLPGGFLAVDVTGDDALAVVRPFLPQTRTAMAISASGEKKYRLVYVDPHSSGGVS
jgi:hypothetical protein